MAKIPRTRFLHLLIKIDNDQYLVYVAYTEVNIT